MWMVQEQCWEIRKNSKTLLQLLGSSEKCTSKKSARAFPTKRIKCAKYSVKHTYDLFEDQQYTGKTAGLPPWPSQTLPPAENLVPDLQIFMLLLHAVSLYGPLIV